MNLSLISRVCRRVRSDPGEQINLAGSPAHAAQVAELSRQLQAAVKASFPPSGKIPEVRANPWSPILVDP
jgi:hypothetical protein